MNVAIDPLYYGLVCTMAVWLALLGLRTRVRRALKRDRARQDQPGSGVPGLPNAFNGSRGTPLPRSLRPLGSQTPVEFAAKLGLGAIALLLVLVPAGGLPLWKWAFSFCPNPSLPLLALIVAALAPRLVGFPLFGAADWRAAWLFGAVVGTILYLQPFCFPGFDLYYWGSHPHVVAWTLAGAALLFLGLGARFGLVFLLTLAAYAFRLLESDNGWEYTMDPFYWMMSVGVVTRWATRAIARRASKLRLRAVEPVQDSSG